MMPGTAIRLASVLILLGALGAAAVGTNDLRSATDLFMSGRYPDAIRACDEVIRIGGLEAGAALDLKAQGLARLKRPDEAVRCWEAALQRLASLSETDGMLFRMAEVLAKEANDPRRAIPVYERLIRQSPRGELALDARMQLAGAHFRLKDYAQAREALLGIRSDFPSSRYEEQVSRGIAACDKELKRQVMAAAEQAEREAAVRERAARTDPRDVCQADRDIAQGEELLRQGKLEEALKRYASARAAFVCPRRDLAVLRTGQCYARLGRERDAGKAWEDVVALSRQSTNAPYLSVALLSLGDLYLEQMGDPEGAVKWYERLQEECPGTSSATQAFEQVAFARLYQGRTDEARRMLRFMRLWVPRETNAPPDRIDRLLALCDGVGATNILPGMAARAAANRAGVQLRLGDLYFVGQQYARARSTYDRAVSEGATGEDAAYALLQQGRCWMQLGDSERAQRCYAPFLDQYRKSQWADDALMRAAVVHVGPQNDLRAGVRVLRTLIERYPQGDMVELAYVRLGTLAYWQGDWREAVRVYREFLDLYPRSAYAPMVRNVRLPAFERQLARAGRG